jgi:hypothetical protein
MPDRFRNRAHGICREHRAAGAAARHHIAFDFLQLLNRKTAGLVGSARLGVIEDGQVVALGGPRPERDAARRAGAGIEHEPKRIGPRQRHQGRSTGFVAAGNHDHGVAMVGVVANLEAVGDDIAGHEAVARRRRALGQRVRHRRCAHDQALPAALGQNFDQEIADGADAVVAAMGVGPGTGDRHHGTGLRGAVRIEAGGTQFDPRFFPVKAAVLRHDGLTIFF